MYEWEKIIKWKREKNLITNERVKNKSRLNNQNFIIMEII